MPLIISPAAEDDLESIGDYIAADNPTRAVSFLRELRKRCRQIIDNPQACPLRQELGAGVRACPHGRYIIFYECDANVVRILRVLHGARDLPTAIQDTES